MPIVRDAATVSSSGGLLHITYDQLWDDGDNMGGELYCELSAAAWLADQIDAAAGPQGAPQAQHTAGPDHFTVYIGGGDRDPNVHVHNRRDASAARGGKTYTLSGVQPTTAQKLAADLRALKP